MVDREFQGPGGGYFCRRDGEFQGPYSREELRAQLIVGSLRPTDLVQLEGSPIWQPVRMVMEQSTESEPPPASEEPPGWPALLHSLARRFQRDLSDPSPRVLLVFLVIGVGGMLLARLGWIVWIPWFVLALIGSVVLFLIRFSVAGLALGVSALALPFFLLPREPKPHASPLVVAADAAPRPPMAATPAPEPREIEGLPTASAPVFSIPAPATPSPAPLPAPDPPAMLAASTPAPPAAAPPRLPPTPSPAPAIATIPEPPPPAATPNTNAYHARNGALVIIRGDGSSGSGFVGSLAGKPYLFTNSHVAAGMKRPVFTLLDGTRLTPVSIEAATGHDIMRFALKEPPRHVIDIAVDLDRKVQIGEPVLVLGNSGGGGVVTNLEGEIVGIGPDRIEVSAEFIPGNSGSPIIHARTGQVLGIATYLTRRREEFTSTQGANRDVATGMVVRRFGYRVDSVTTWQPVNWLAFQAESDQIDKIGVLTEDIINFLNSLRQRRDPRFATETLRRPALDWRMTISRKGVSEVDRRTATQRFLSSMRYMARSDVNAAEATLRYSYFRDKLKEERVARDELYKAFDTELSRMTAPSLQR